MNDLPLPQNDTNNALDVSRRDFVKTSSFAAAMSMLGGVPLFAQDAKPAAPAAGAHRGPVRQPARRLLDGLRELARHSGFPITVTEAQPGGVDTAMLKTDRPLPAASLSPPD